MAAGAVVTLHKPGHPWPRGGIAGHDEITAAPHQVQVNLQPQRSRKSCCPRRGGLSSKGTEVPPGHGDTAGMAVLGGEKEWGVDRGAGTTGPPGT